MLLVCYCWYFFLSGILRVFCLLMFLVYLFLSPETKAINFQARNNKNKKKHLFTKRSTMKIAKNVLGTSGKKEAQTQRAAWRWTKCLSCTFMLYNYYENLWNLTKNHFFFFLSKFHAALNYICIKIMENITTTKNIFINMKSNFTVTISFWQRMLLELAGQS